MNPFPNIVLSSYLGPDSERRVKRLKWHLKARAQLHELYPDLRVLSICSDYSPEEEQAMKGWDCIFLPERTLRWKKQNLVLKELYARRRNEAVLLLDDDIVPVDREGGMEDSTKYLYELLVNPGISPAPCLYFICYEVVGGYYFQKLQGKGDYVAAPMGVTGWGTWVRSDLGVLFEEKDVVNPEVGPALDDTPVLRAKCMEMGKRVLRCNRVLLSTYQHKDEQSAWFKDREHRKLIIQRTREHLLRHFPLLFYRDGEGEISSVTKRSLLGHPGGEGQVGQIDTALIVNSPISFDQIEALTGLSREAISYHIWHIKNHHPNWVLEQVDNTYQLVPQKQVHGRAKLFA